MTQAGLDLEGRSVSVSGRVQAPPVGTQPQQSSLSASEPERLAVYARYTRRGGLDINPFRTNFNLPMPDNARLARQ